MLEVACCRSAVLRCSLSSSGTNTDAVLLDADKSHSPVLNWVKVPTTPNVTEGIQHGIEDLLKLSTIVASDIKCVTVGTTVLHCRLVQ